MKIIAVLSLLTLVSCQSGHKVFSPDYEVKQENDSLYIEDFSQYWTTINESFAYFNTQKTNWEKVRELYQPMIDTVSDRNGFITLLEKCNGELYNGHVGLNTNIGSSSKLIPSSTDIWLVKKDGEYIIESIRENSKIETTKLTLGMKVLEFNGKSIHEAIKEFLPKSFSNYDDRVYEFAANTLIAGKHNIERIITVSIDGKEESIPLPYSTTEDYYSDDELLTYKTLENNIGFIRINNSLWNNKLISAFDDALDSLSNTSSLILDLRETPSGGNNTIAKAIMGKFIQEEAPYQRYRYVYDEKETGIEQYWVEQVMPRESPYTKPMVLLVGRWTGSMGEGITIGFDSFENIEIVGTELADLLGVVWGYTLDNTNIGFQIPGVRLYHMNKSPREDFVPSHYFNKNSDCLKKAIELLSE